MTGEAVATGTRVTIRRWDVRMEVEEMVSVSVNDSEGERLTLRLRPETVAILGVAFEQMMQYAKGYANEDLKRQVLEAYEEYVEEESKALGDQLTRGRRNGSSGSR